MGYRWIYSITVRTLLLVGGVVLVTLGIVYGKGGLLVAGLLLCAASIFIFRKMQQQLREKSWLMLEAIRNRDYSFRLPVYGFSGGERVLQDTLNRFGGLMSEQKQLMEQRERFYEQILSSVTSGIIVLDEKSTKTTIPFFKNNNLDYADFVGFMGESAQSAGCYQGWKCS